MFRNIVLLCLSLNFEIRTIKCDNWWKNVLIYEIQPQAFKDSNGDGIGDIQGIISKLDYINELGIAVIRLPYIYPLVDYPVAYFDCIVTDHKTVDKMLGTMKDMENLIREINKRGMKLVLDFVPNHTSESHVWFLKSTVKEEPFTDYYIWKDGGNDNTPPNNWYNLGRTRTSWQITHYRDQYYYFSSESYVPDLNLRNPLVIQELKDILKFWLDKGVNGFYLRNPLDLIEDELFRDEPNPFAKPSECIYSRNLLESYQLIHEFRKYIEDYNTRNGSVRLLIVDTERENIDHIIRFYGEENYEIAHFPVDNSILRKFNSIYLTADDFKNSIDLLLDNIPKGHVAAWQTESSFLLRIPNVLDDEYIDIYNAFTLLLPGVATTFYGQEFGLRSTSYLFVMFDYFSISNEYGFTYPLMYFDYVYVMLWDNTTNAGFTSGNTELIVNNNYWKCNVKIAQENENSHYHFYKKLAKLRKEPTFKQGDTKTYALSEYIFAFARSIPDHEMFIIVSNLDYITVFVDLQDLIPHWASSLHVSLRSTNAVQKEGQIYEKNEENKLIIPMRPKSLVVLKTIKKDKNENIGI